VLAGQVQGEIRESSSSQRQRCRISIIGSQLLGHGGGGGGGGARERVWALVFGFDLIESANPIQAVARASTNVV
jgi:hypothetical protein